MAFSRYGGFIPVESGVFELIEPIILDERDSGTTYIGEGEDSVRSRRCKNRVP